MILNDAGKMVERWYREMENGLQTDDGFQTNNGFQTDNGFKSDNGSKMGGCSEMGAHVGAPLRGRPFIQTRPIIDENDHPIISECDQQNDIKTGKPNIEKYGLHNQK